MHLEGKWYVEKVLSMGCSVSCALLECFSKFLQWVFTRQMGYQLVTHYLDDSFFMEAPGSADCQTKLASFQEFMGDLGVPLAPEKIVGPTRCCHFWALK